MDDVNVEGLLMLPVDHVSLLSEDTQELERQTGICNIQLGEGESLVELHHFLHVIGGKAS